MAKPITVKSIKSKVVKQMKDLGTYRKEFEMIIDIFAGMLFQYQKLAQDYADMGYPVTDVYVNKAGAENERKVPILTAMEILRKDILSYSNQLMLNPKSLGEVVEQDKGSPLAEVMKFKNELKKKRVNDG
ncbi:hypothetical protein HO412_00735 [Streptococcus suis]|nr:hypothetical protein [Streptococcus suis]NQR94967.1 hypothetical protein [Streptococcus suis]HEM4246439.1 P27 family phage terminase small subunit [Streptococcus suis]HEM5710093.1 P27 family phage terminase small subunit [Streptococcus suis]